MMCLCPHLVFLSALSSIRRLEVEPHLGSLLWSRWGKEEQDGGNLDLLWGCFPSLSVISVLRFCKSAEWIDKQTAKILFGWPIPVCRVLHPQSCDAWLKHCWRVLFKFHLRWRWNILSAPHVYILTLYMDSAQGKTKPTGLPATSSAFTGRLEWMCSPLFSWEFSVTLQPQDGGIMRTVVQQLDLQPPKKLHVYRHCVTGFNLSCFGYKSLAYLNQGANNRGGVKDCTV